MAAIGVLRTVEGGRLGFHCPGCDEMHMVCVDPAAPAQPVIGAAKWGWNGSYDRPTFTPSVLMKSGHHISTHRPGEPCWCDFEARTKRAAPFKCTVCHSFVSDGHIQFLPDCTHALAGQTVPLVAQGD